MQVSIESGYLSQRGTNVDLDLLTARAELHSAFNKLHLRFGIEMYRRGYLNSDFAFNGGYVRSVSYTHLRLPTTLNSWWYGGWGRG